ncbi:MAG: hypothetical protein JOZ81_12710 [Chloroflexi bacterium]|nr:hypothetical protein [Chloroflexota bacterium]
MSVAPAGSGKTVLVRSWLGTGEPIDSVAHNLRLMKSADDACNARDYTVFLEQPSGYGHVDRPVFTTFFTMLSPTLLTPETSAVLIVDYQHHVMVGIN